MAEVVELLEAQLAFIEWLILTKGQREELELPSSHEAMAVHLGYSKPTLYRWKQNEAFAAEYDRRLMQTVGNPEKLNHLYNKIYDLAMDGSPKHAELLLKLANKIQHPNTKVTVNTVDHDARAFTDEELERAIAKAALAEQERRRAYVEPLRLVEGD